MVINSSNNLILHNRIERITGTGLTHGFYIQSGYNVFDGNSVESASGYSYHAWQKVPNLDGSGNRFVNNISLNPGFQHMIVSGLPGLNRNVTIIGNVFRQTNATQTVGLAVDIPAIVTDNTFENIGKTGGAVIEANGAGSIIRGNRISGTASGFYGIRVQQSALVEGNVIDAAVLNGITTTGTGGNGTVVRGNRINGSGIVVSAAQTRIEGNDVTTTGTAIKLFLTDKVIVRDNVLTAPIYIDAPANSTATLDRNVLR
jgi:hypothetical protein